MTEKAINERNARIAEILNKEYDDVEATTNIINKNGEIFHGISVKAKGKTVGVNIYTERLPEDMTPSQMAREIYGIYLRNPAPEITADKLSDINFIKNHVKLAIQNTAAHDELLVSRQKLDDLEQYMYMAVDSLVNRDLNTDHMTVKITKQLLDDCKLTEEDLWKQAEDNTWSDLEIKTMSEVFTELIGSNPYGKDVIKFSFDDIENILDNENMLMVSNTEKFKGASQMFNPKIVNLCKENNLVVIPSSIHEILLVRASMVDVLNEMITEINTNEVKPEDRLSNHYYNVA